MFPLRACLESLKAMIDTVFDRSVVAGFKVQVRSMFKSAPVTAKQGALATEKESTGDESAAVLRSKQLHCTGQCLYEGLEEFLIQVGV